MKPLLNRLEPTAAPPANAERRVIFLDELRSRSDREVCLGAAEYAAEHPEWVFETWPITFLPGSAPRPADLRVADGIVTTERVSRRLRDLYRRVPAPIVYYLADAPHPAADGVGIAEEAVGALAAEHLAGRGYRHFACFGSSGLGWSLGRQAGYLAALRRAGFAASTFSVRPALVPSFWSANLDCRDHCLEELLQRLPKPCGIFAANDVLACYLVRAARQNHYLVPEDVGVVGVDNDPVSNAAAGLAISSIELPFRQVGREAARLLEERWAGRPPGKQVRLRPVRVVVRASTNMIMTEDPLVRRAQAYIESQRGERLTVERVRRSIGCDRSTLERRFQRELDTTIRDYLRRRRLECAAERLRGGQLSVQEVAFQCGFASVPYFSRLFKRVTGRSPGTLRRGQA